ncbi:MAG TPA: DMT family transporter [Alphaproteobacteria bacterium]|nr:DMT family transporter [Alphaproteobacteria bacterium]
MTAYTTGKPNRLRGLLLMIGAGLCWSTGGILVRSTEIANGWEIVFWRSLFMVVALGLILTVWHRGAVLRKFVAVGIWGVITGGFLALTFFFFILALTLTTVANTLVTMSIMPFVAALLGWIALKEPIAPRTWVAMAAAAAGLVMMFADSLRGDGALGMLVALGVPLAFAANLIVVRHHASEVDMVPTVLIAGVISALAALPAALPFSASLHDVAVLALMGTVQLGIGCMLMTLAARDLSAAEVGLLSLLETTLGPIWVWIGIGERPSDVALIGGLCVVGALALNGALGLVQERAHAPAE